MDKLRKLNLDTTVNVTSDYFGQFAGQYISSALLEGVTIGNSLISINENVKYKWRVKKAGLSGILSDATCDFTPQGSVVLTDRILTPKELNINAQLCKADFRSDYEAEAMGFSAYDELPPKFSEWLIAQALATIAQETELSIWQGDATNSGEFDGFTKLFAADSDVIDVDSAGVTITDANVKAEMAKVVDAIPETIYGNEDLYLYVSPSIARAYIRALGGFAANGQGAAGIDNKGFMWYNMNTPLYMDGIAVMPVKGLPNGQMVAAQKSNLWFGTGKLSDSNEIRVIDTAEILGDQNVRIVGRYTAGVQYGIGSEVVYYWNAP